MAQEAPKKMKPLTASQQLAAARPLVSVYKLDGTTKKKSVKMPDVMLTPIRADIVDFVHTNMNKNRRQPYGVQIHYGPKGTVAGHQVSAKSWGTGRAVARVARVKGGGTHRAGQGAFGNMCRGGRMFAPTKTWRKWHRKINTNQKRYAVCSALSASSVPSLVMARGHRVSSVEELPIVVTDALEEVYKTKNAVKILDMLRLSSELKKCKKRYKRAGRGKSRNRRWKHRVGPLIIYKTDRGCVQAFRNIRGVDLCKVSQLNLLKLAPGGHVGRLIVWTEGAFNELQRIYGQINKRSKFKKNYLIPRGPMTNSDLRRIIFSENVQSVLKPKQKRRRNGKKRNPLKRPLLMAKLNPAYDPSVKGPMFPERKRPKREMSADDKEKMKKYYDLVMGDDVLFKTREQLQAEREAVLEQIKQAQREKLGLDIMDDDEMQGNTATTGGGAHNDGNDSDESV